MLDDIVEVSLAVSAEVAKVDVSLTPLAMIRIFKPRTHDLLPVKPKKFPSFQCDPCGLAVRVRNDLREHKKSELRNLSLQCDPCGEGADVSKDLKNIKRLNVICPVP